MGTTPGVPDLLIWTRSSGFGIELKAGAGKLSPAQVAWHATVTSLGHRVYVCRSVDDVERCLRAEGVPPVGTLAAVTHTDVQERARGRWLAKRHWSRSPHPCRRRSRNRPKRSKPRSGRSPSGRRPGAVPHASRLISRTADRPRSPQPVSTPTRPPPE